MKGSLVCCVRKIVMEKIVLEIAIKKLSEAFNEFIGACLAADGKPKAPDLRAMMKARGFLPPYCEHAHKKKVIPPSPS